MNAADLLEQAVALRREGRSFALATVVSRRAPVSAHLGDRAIVFADGRMVGFVGGACSHEIIRTQALDVLRTRRSRLVSIRPDAREPAAPSAEHVVVPMTCVSEGAIDVYVEPFVQSRQLIVAGATPIADALARLARSMDYDVVRLVEDREQRDIEAEATRLDVRVVTLDGFAAALRAGDGSADRAGVVASQGHYDEEALEAMLRDEVPYIALVASPKRGTAVKALLEKRGVPGTAAIRSPAGLDLGARTPSEVALSILAEIVQANPREAHAETPLPASAAAAAPATAIDPVCGMNVEIATARHTATVDGHVYYFCCASCRERFLDDPPRYRAHTS